LTVQKTSASACIDSNSLTRFADTPEPLRLVTMQMGEDTGFGYFDPARRRNQCSKTGIGKTALTALQRGRVDYAP
jgi:hypothetical protein